MNIKRDKPKRPRGRARKGLFWNDKLGKFMPIPGFKYEKKIETRNGKAKLVGQEPKNELKTVVLRHLLDEISQYAEPKEEPIIINKQIYYIDHTFKKIKLVG